MNVGSGHHDERCWFGPSPTHPLAVACACTCALIATVTLQVTDEVLNVVPCTCRCGPAQYGWVHADDCPRGIVQAELLGDLSTPGREDAEPLRMV